MADLAKTSRISVIIDCLLVLVVAYKSPISIDRVASLASDTEFLETNFWIHTETIFVGLGVLSFAFVCQHSAFIIAGSLERPTLARWSQVTQAALMVCASLALLCGSSGYLGFLDDTRGNIINNLQVTDILSNVARGMLGTTMLFVYPMESFVARHVCVVLLFEGRRAHEGEDASILARRDRRIGLTVALYISALLPAILFEDVGQVLAATGSVGGSCLSYIGPGGIYMGIHGDKFLALVRHSSWWGRFAVTEDNTGVPKEINLQLPHATETTSLIPAEVGTARKISELSADNDNNNICITALQTATCYLCAMPLWSWIAQFGETTLAQHHADLALKSPHPNRIGDVTANTPRATRLGADENFQLLLPDARASSFHERGAGSLTSAAIKGLKSFQDAPGTPKKSLNDQIGARLLESRRQQQQQSSLEKDPQKTPPTVLDFLIAIFFMLFGIVAMCAGLVSIAMEKDGRR